MHLKALAVVASLFALSAPATHAVTVTWGTSAETPSMDVATNLGVPQGVSFTWRTAPAGGWIEFTTDAAWALQLHFYGVGDATPTDEIVSAYILKSWNTVTGVWDNLTTQTDACSTATLVPLAGDCNLMGSTVYSGSESVLRPGEIAGRYAAGKYLLGVGDSEEPSNTSAEFYVAAVPLPASLLGLIAGLGGLGMLGLRRRRTLV